MVEVEVKGWRNGLLLVLPPEGDWAEVLGQLDDKLNAANVRSFWRGAQTTLDLGGRVLSPADLDALVGRLKNAYGLVPVGVVSVDAPTREGAGTLGLGAYDELPIPRKPARDKNKPAHNALYLKQTVRSGQRVVHEGHLVIAGDVNAGAEVVAEGDIVIFGTLRGMAHAGCFGDEGAQIMASHLRPMQLRIAGLIARAPEPGAGPQGRSPEVARVISGEIQVSPL